MILYCIRQDWTHSHGVRNLYPMVRDSKKQSSELLHTSRNVNSTAGAQWLLYTKMSLREWKIECRRIFHLAGIRTSSHAAVKLAKAPSSNANLSSPRIKFVKFSRIITRKIRQISQWIKKPPPSHQLPQPQKVSKSTPTPSPLLPEPLKPATPNRAPNSPLRKSTTNLSPRPVGSPSSSQGKHTENKRKIEKTKNGAHTTRRITGWYVGIYELGRGGAHVGWSSPAGAEARGVLKIARAIAGRRCKAQWARAREESGARRAAIAPSCRTALPQE